MPGKSPAVPLRVLVVEDSADDESSGHSETVHPSTAPQEDGEPEQHRPDTSAVSADESDPTRNPQNDDQGGPQQRAEEEKDQETDR